MVFLPNLGVNRRACLCGVVLYASAQALDFLDLEQKSSLLDWKHLKVPVLDNGHLWTGTSLETAAFFCKTGRQTLAENKDPNRHVSAIRKEECPGFFNKDKHI